jgi:ElaB/YqjD/DUF883 family membrane-anchored ribosome-binding protein
MMNRAMQEFDQARGRMAGDFRSMISDSEDLLKAAATVSGARTRFEARLKSAKARLAQASQPLLDGTMESAAMADGYVRANPWTAVGVAVAAGVLLGFLAAKR